ncbi:response regulator transcription factor [Paenibacillus sp. OSY-SE]|uniref:response regulator transcription factor n=1 Tax=Paenibacillus sp. OSY-SE TaxID=1196323 RepID=UPI00031311D7|nr:response regulator [Paenibacillus sp. OSY-SE]
MYKLLLVDDEEDVREGLLREIEWSGCGYEVIGTAENGREAIEAVDKLRPDVVVTDIQMPFLNGLQLSEGIREQFPTIKIIILTGYDEFEYAQKAVKLHIDEYVLKPFSSQELIDVLLKVKTSMDEEQAQRENVHVLQEHYRSSLPVLKEVFLASLFTRKVNRKEIDEKSRIYDLPLCGSQFMLSVISLDIPCSLLSNRKEEEPSLQPFIQQSPQRDAGVPQHALSLKDTGDSRLQLFAVYNIAEEIVHKHELGFVMIHNEEVVLISCDESPDMEPIRQRTLLVLEEIRQSVERYLRFSVTAGAGTVIHTLEEAPYAYNAAIAALDYRVILGSNRVICIDDVEMRMVEKLCFDHWKEEALIRCLKVGTAEELRGMLDSLFQGLMEAHISVKDFQIYVMEMLIALMKVARDAGQAADTAVGDELASFERIREFRHMEEAKQWVLQLCTRLMHHIAADRQTSYKKLVQEATSFVEANYENSDLSITMVCGHLHISAGYFSSIFKKETKMTFINYLLQLRMEKAKQYLRSTDWKTFEIAEQVGYSDPNYFSYSFKKYAGLSPKEYRSRADEG